MMLFALFGFILCANAIGLSEQGLLSLPQYMREKLNPTAGEITRISNRPEGSVSGQDHMSEPKLTTEIASKNPENKLTAPTQNLDPMIYDEGTMRPVGALQSIENDKSRVENLAERSSDVLLEDERSAGQAAEYEQPELKELAQLSAWLGPDSNKLKLFDSKGLVMSKRSNSHQAILDAADEAIDAVRRKVDTFQIEAKRLTNALESYKQQAMEARLDELFKNWEATSGAFQSGLGLRNVKKINQLAGLFKGAESLTSVRKDLRLLIAASVLTHTKVEAEIIAKAKLFSMPCKALIKHDEPSGTLESFFKLSTAFDSEMLGVTIGKSGDARSKLAQWAGRWGICDWVLKV